MTGGHVFMFVGAGNSNMIWNQYKQWCIVHIYPPESMLCDTAEERILNTGLFSDRGRGGNSVFTGSVFKCSYYLNSYLNSTLILLLTRAHFECQSKLWRLSSCVALISESGGGDIYIMLCGWELKPTGMKSSSSDSGSPQRHHTAQPCHFKTLPSIFSSSAAPPLHCTFCVTLFILA